MKIAVPTREGVVDNYFGHCDHYTICTVEEGAKNKLSQHNIRVVRGCTGNVEAVVEAFLKGFVFDSGVGCHAHECGEHNH